MNHYPRPAAGSAFRGGAGRLGSTRTRLPDYRSHRRVSRVRTCSASDTQSDGWPPSRSSGSAGQERNRRRGYTPVYEHHGGPHGRRHPGHRRSVLLAAPRQRLALMRLHNPAPRHRLCLHPGGRAQPPRCEAPLCVPESWATHLCEHFDHVAVGVPGAAAHPDLACAIDGHVDGVWIVSDLLRLCFRGRRCQLGVE